MNSRRQTPEKGSITAKNGFKNEDIVITKFNNWKNDSDAQSWLQIMKYDLNEIEHVEAVKIQGYKTDVQAKITIFIKHAISAENLSIKLVSNKRGYNQIDKRWIDKYVEMWNIPQDVTYALKLFTGEIKPPLNFRNQKRLKLNQLEPSMQKKIIDFFTRNKILVVSDILKGREKFPAGWMLVALKSPKSNGRTWVLKPINYVLNHYGNGSVQISPRGSLSIGRITMQRKGGDGGRETAKMLQFKMNPAELFE